MAYQVGDVVNGYKLGPDNQWHPDEPALVGQAEGAHAKGAPAAPPPPPPPAGASVTAPPSDAAPKKKPLYKRWWVILLALVVLFAIIRSVTGSSTSPAPTSAPAPAASGASASPAPAAPAPAAPVGLNTPVKDGAFEFTVSKVQCGVPNVGTSGLGKAAQGQFCLVSMNVKNIGDRSQLFDGSSQKALDAQGRKLSADGGAAVYLPESKSFLNNINPGNQVSGVVVYDIPKDAKITELELHDSMFSGGVKVKVA